MNLCVDCWNDESLDGRKQAAEKCGVSFAAAFLLLLYMMHDDRTRRVVQYNSSSEI